MSYGPYHPFTFVPEDHTVFKAEAIKQGYAFAVGLEADGGWRECRRWLVTDLLPGSPLNHNAKSGLARTARWGSKVRHVMFVTDLNNLPSPLPISRAEAA